MWHNQGVGTDGENSSEGSGRRRTPRPLDEERLRELALHYVGRFATTRAKLATYLGRKLRERGWAGEGAPDLPALVERLADLGYVDDRAFAEARARSMARKGLGARRITQDFRAAGIDEGDAAELAPAIAERASDAALAFARRRRIGPFGDGNPDRAVREKQIAAMLRAGHGFDLARRIVSLAPGEALGDCDEG